jgi:hypothetical protein
MVKGDHTPIHTATVVRNWQATRTVQVLLQLLYSPDLTPADLSLFRKLEELVGLHISKKSRKTPAKG